MKNLFLFACLLFTLNQLQAQQATTHSMHFSQNGFVQNEGQFSDEHGRVNNQVEFLYAKDDFHLALKPSGFSYELIQETPDVHNFPESGFSDPDDLQDWRDAQTMKESVSRVDVALKGANPHPVIVTDQNTGTLYNYYLGKLSVVNVPSFNRITYKNIYPGIDMVFEDHSETGGDPEYSFIVHPGGDVHQIQMKYSGAGNVSLEDQHTLSIAMPQGFIKETGLRGYWLEDGSASDVSFRLKNGMLSFNASVDKNKTLVIDPSIVWGSYFGGKGEENWDTESEIALDGNNNVYLSGSTLSPKNIATSGAVMQTYGGSRDMLLAKFDLDGKHVLWATYFGGSEQDIAYGIGCDSHNNVVITGFSKSPNVMTTPGAFQDTLLGHSDALIAKFSTTGQLIWSTLMGGSDDISEPEHGRSLTFDANDDIFICGYVTSSTNISTPGTFQPNYKGKGDAFLVKFTKDGNKIWGTYFSGAKKDRAHAVCLDLFGHVYFTGTAQSPKFFISGGFQTHFGGSEDGIIAKFDTSGHHIWSSYYGGSGGDRGRGVKCDGSGCVYFEGWTNSVETNVMSTPNSFQPNFGGDHDGFIVKFSPTGSRIWGTYIGGNKDENLFGMSIDAEASIYVCGNSSSQSGITTPDAFQPNFAGIQDAIMAKFDSAGHRIWATYFGGSGIDDSYDIERDNTGMIYLDLNTFGPLPVSPDAYQTIVRGQDDLAVFEFNFNPPPCPDNNEPNEGFLSPHVSTDPLTPAGTTLNGAVSTATDQDWFAFHLNPTDTAVNISLTGLTKNYDLTIFDSNAVVIASSANAGTADEEISLNDISGTITIEIAHDNLNFDPYNCYTLHINLDSTGEKLSETISTSLNHLLKIYPNPTSGLVTIAFESSRENEMTITAFDAIGRAVFSRAMPATEGINTFLLNLSELNEGIYLLQVKGGDVRGVMKFTIEK